MRKGQPEPTRHTRAATASFGTLAMFSNGEGPSHTIRAGSQTCGLSPRTDAPHRTPAQFCPLLPEATRDGAESFIVFSFSLAAP